MTTVVLLLGSNLGSRTRHLDRARTLISRDIGCIVKSSSIYETEAWGMASDTPSFLNQVVVCHTSHSARKILNKTDRIEEKEPVSTPKKGAYHSRKLDIDILFFGDQVIHEEGLHIPHPLIHKRNFVLEPLREILPDLIHPELNESIESLYRQSTDDCNVTLYS